MIAIGGLLVGHGHQDVILLNAAGIVSTWAALGHTEAASRVWLVSQLDATRSWRARCQP
jgi:hypothetical protein